MCSSVERILIKEREEGRVGGTVETLKELGYSDEFILDKIIEKFEITRDEVLKYL